MTKSDKLISTSIDCSSNKYKYKYKVFSMEEQRHLQLMTFMSEFRTSIEDSIKKTNTKIDDNMKDLNIEMKQLKDRMDTTETDSNDILRRMDNRLNLLEREMKKSEGQRRMRTQLKQTTGGTEVRSDKTTFKRLNISEDDLAREDTIIDLEPSSYKSTWAAEMQEELEKSATMSKQKTTKTTRRKPVPPPPG